MMLVRSPRPICAALGVLAAVILSAISPAQAGTKITSVWSAPDLEAGNFRRMVILARFTDESARRILEDAMVERLAKEGIEALAGWQVLKAEDLAGEEAIAAKVEELKIDSGIVFTIAGEGQKVKSGSRVSANVGVPVRAGPFSVFLGTSVPLGGGPSVEKTVALKAVLHAVEGENPRWMADFSTDLKGGTDRVAADLAKQTVKQLKKAGLFDR